VIVFGTGGRLVEVYKDRALGLPPLNTTLARRMIEQTKIGPALKGVRGRRSIDMAELERVLVRFSQLVVEQPWIREIDMNPLLAAPEKLLALDARVVLHGAAVRESDLPRPAIRPYPAQYVGAYRTKDGAEVTIRPISPEDEPLMVRFHQRLSERSVYFRYFHTMQLDQRVAHERLTRICFIDYDREMALVAEHRDAATGEREILGVGRMTKVRGLTFNEPEEAEFAVLVTDDWQNRGLGTELLRRLIPVGRDEKLRRLTGEILVENRGMQKVCERLGFTLKFSPEDGTVEARLALD
jgi:acetyltransferase